MENFPKFHTLGQFPTNKQNHILSEPQIQANTNVMCSRNGSGEDRIVWVRFITLSDALSKTMLTRISPHPTPFPCSTTIRELERKVSILYWNELLAVSKGGEETFVSNIKVDLHVAEYRLSTSWATLSMYKLNGPTKDDPLDLFIVLRFSTWAPNGSSLASAPECNGLSMGPSWYPVAVASKASISTFYCCLYMLRTKLIDGSVRRRFLTALWEVTHFPPCVRAMSLIFENGTLTDSDIATLSSTIFALARNFVPRWVTNGGESAKILEGSRQVIGWILDQAISRKRGGTGSESEDPWGSKVIVEPLTLSNIPYLREPGNYMINLSLPRTNQSASFRVRYLNEDDRVHPSPAQLALAFAFEHVYGGNTYLLFPRRFSKYTQHRLVNHPNEDGFYEQVINTNSIPTLSIVAPLSLSRCQPPCLTLNKEGMVSVWDHGAPCTREWARIWNPVMGTEVLTRNDRGQNLAKQLEPILKHKKEDGSWFLDGWDIGGINISSVDSRRPSEGVIICLDTSSSMDKQFESRNDTFSRLCVAKLLFKQFSETVSNIDVPVYFGGFSFSTTVTVFPRLSTDLSPLIDHVHSEVEALRSDGRTSIWDALYEAKKMLLEFKRSQPSANLRIILLTDGEDNSSTRSAEQVLRELWEENIVVDSVMIGDHSIEEHDIFKFSKATGGYGIRPKTIGEIMEISQMETLVSTALRPTSRQHSLPLVAFTSPLPTYDLSCPPALQMHENQNDTFVRFTFATRAFRNRTVGNTSAATSSRRIMEDMKNLIKHSHPFIDVYVSEANLFFWKGIMEGPSHTAYQEGTFIFFMDMGNDFPTRPPQVRFLTPILHPNITRQGRVCHPIIEEEWTSSTSLRDVMNQIYGLLMAPEIESSAVDVVTSTNFLLRDKLFSKDVAAHIKKYASRSRAELEVDVLGSI